MHLAASLLCNAETTTKLKRAADRLASMESEQWMKVSTFKIGQHLTSAAQRTPRLARNKSLLPLTRQFRSFIVSSSSSSFVQVRQMSRVIAAIHRRLSLWKASARPALKALERLKRKESLAHTLAAVRSAAVSLPLRTRPEPRDCAWKRKDAGEEGEAHLWSRGKVG